MDEKQDPEAQVRRYDDATTPLISGERPPNAYATAPRIVRIRLYLLSDPFWRLRFHLALLGTLLLWLSLLYWSDSLRSYPSDSDGYVASSAAGGAPFISTESSNKVTQVANLPSVLVPRTYVHRSDTNKRLVVVADVHGAYPGLVDLLSRISFNASNDHLIFAGDMVNKGPQSHESVSLMRSLNASCVRGNHEDRILAIREAYDADPDSFTPDNMRDFETAKQLSKKDIEWLQMCPLILRLGQLPGHNHKSTVVVHAGILPLVSLKDQEPFDVMHMRSISKVTGKGRGRKHRGRKHHSRVKFRAFEDRNDGDEPWWKVWNKVQDRLSKGMRTLVLYGHDAGTGLIQKEWSIGLDSGCVSGGRLSAMIYEGLDEKTSQPRERIESVACEDLS